MKPQGKDWALILAAGSGTRLQSLTTVDRAGPVPKQFWSLAGGASLLEETLERAFAITAPSRVMVVVSASHEPYWRDILRLVPEENIVVQPHNRGTALGILLGVAAIRPRDPDARIVVLPSDHFVAREAVLRRSVRGALDTLRSGSRAISFLGVKPESDDPELGYIVLGAPDLDGGYRIAEFVEKPSRRAARRLIARAALWNSFILVATAQAFVELVAARYPAEASALLDAVEDVWAWRDAAGSAALEALYAGLPSIDFSRDIVAGASAELRVVPVSACGWSDLGTPQRVAECLGRLGTRGSSAASQAALSLAEAHSRMGRLAEQPA